MHLYLDVDHGILHDIINHDLDQLERFAAAVIQGLDAAD